MLPEATDPLILLLAGTAETAPLAGAMAEAGYRVLVSTATDVALDIGNAVRRIGRLDRAAIRVLIAERGIAAIVDATHPYATEAHATAFAAAADCAIPCLRYERPPTEIDGWPVTVAADHEEAARLAFAMGRPVVLTTGSRNLEPYARAAHETGLPWAARVLPHAESLAACRQAGLSVSQILAARGPFTIDETRAFIRRFGAGVLVTKDGGREGGLPEKLAAARAEGCAVILIRRPAILSDASDQAFATIDSLLAALKRLPPLV